MKATLFLSIVVLFTSCTGLINFGIKKYGFYDDRLGQVEVLTKKNQEIVLIPMKHIGTPKFYENVSHLIDSLNTEGFYYYLEGIGTKTNDSSTLDTIARKWRKITNLPLARNSEFGGPIDTVNNTFLFGKRNIQLKKKYHYTA